MTGNIVPIWTRQDAVDTATAFHRELSNAERGMHSYCRSCGRSHLVCAITPDGVCRYCRPWAHNSDVGPSSHPDEGVATAVIGEGHTPRLGRILFSRSRFRKARILDARKALILDALAVGLLILVLAIVGCAAVLLSAPHAKADDSDALAYAAHYGSVICDVLDERPGSIPGLMGVLQGVQEHSGMDEFDSGQAVGLAVADICPRHMPLLRRFVAAYGKPGAVA